MYLKYSELAIPLNASGLFPDAPSGNDIDKGRLGSALLVKIKAMDEINASVRRDFFKNYSPWMVQSAFFFLHSFAAF